MSLESQYSKLSLSSDSKLFSDQYYQTTFAGFYINNIVDPVVAFSLGLSASFDTNTDINIPFDIVNVDSNNGWNRSSSIYVVQVPGVYVISYSLAASAYQNPFVQLYATQSFVAGLYSSGGRNGIEMLSRTVLVDLVEGDQVRAVLSSTYGGVYSDIRYQTSMKGFLYKPYRTAPVSWCVVWENSVASTTIAGPVDPVAFNILLVNQGSGWDEALNRFTAPLSGVYYIQLTAGIAPENPTKMELLINGTPVINVYRQFTSHSDRDTRSKAVIIRLQQGDELRIRLPSGYYLQTSAFRYTGFAGFRLYA